MSDRDSSPEPMDNGRSPNGQRSEASDVSEGARSPRPVGRSRSRSRSPEKRKRRSRSRSYERKSKREASPSIGGDRGERRRSRSPGSSRRRPNPERETPPIGRCLGIFGLSIHTHQRDLEDVFGKYGPIEDVQIVFDAQTGRSRGFAFVYFKDKNDAQEAKDRCNGIDINGRQIRVDFSLTQRAHTPTPGIYMGRPSHLSDSKGPPRREGGGGGGGGRRDGGDRGFGGGRDNGYGGRDRRDRDFRDRDHHQRRRSPSPHYRGGGGGGRDHRSPPRSRYHR